MLTIYDHILFRTATKDGRLPDPATAKALIDAAIRSKKDERAVTGRPIPNPRDLQNA